MVCIEQWGRFYSTVCDFICQHWRTDASTRILVNILALKVITSRLRVICTYSGIHYNFLIQKYGLNFLSSRWIMLPTICWPNHQLIYLHLVKQTLRPKFLKSFLLLTTYSCDWTHRLPPFYSSCVFFSSRTVCACKPELLSSCNENIQYWSILTSKCLCCVHLWINGKYLEKSYCIYHLSNHKFHL